jgi:hypothetical protein
VVPSAYQNHKFCAYQNHKITKSRANSTAGKRAAPAKGTAGLWHFDRSYTNKHAAVSPSTANTSLFLTVTPN